MTLAVYVTFIGLTVVVLFIVVGLLARRYQRYRDSQMIICPDTGESAMVEVDAMHAALTSFTGTPDIRLRHCWRWPLHEGCGQECLTQLEVAPQECLVTGVLRRWYKARNCVYCGRQFGEVHFTDHKPALRNHDGQLFEWHELSAGEIQLALNTYSPVCWNCYIAQSFRRDHPELVVDRLWQQGIPRGHA